MSDPTKGAYIGDGGKAVREALLRERLAHLEQENQYQRLEIERLRAALLKMKPSSLSVNAHGVDWGAACGRHYLAVSGQVVAIEGDTNRETGSRWTDAEIQRIVADFWRPLGEAAEQARGGK